MWVTGDRETSLADFRLAYERNPDNLTKLLEFVSALGRCYRIAEAVELLEKAVVLADSDPQMISEIAKKFVGLNRHGRAIRLLEAVPHRVDTAAITAQRAVYYELTGQFPAAELQIRKAIAAAPEQPETWLVLARILAHQEKLDEALEVIERLARYVDGGNANFALQICYETARIQDRRAEYSQAYSAAVKAKSIQKRAPQAEPLARTMIERGFQLAKLYQQLDAATLDVWLAEKVEPLPNGIRPAHLIGFPRSGTTLMEQILHGHSGLVVSSESRVFPDDIVPRLLQSERRELITPWDAVQRIQATDLNELRRLYLDSLQSVHQDSFEGKVHVDKKPANTEFLFALLRVLPESKFIVAIRDPRDVMVSCFMRYFGLTDMSACFLSWGSAAVLYAQYMEIWLYIREMLPPDRWLEVRYEDMVSDAPGQAARIFRFLDVAHEDVGETYLATSEKRYVHSPTFADVRRPIHSQRVARWENYAEHLQPHLSLLEPFVNALGYT
jgi:tetratricopeptide (TPR) repeat protein